jgi:hypothetical protein
VTLAGAVTANAAHASVRFDIGTSTSYGKQIPSPDVGGVAAAAVSAGAVGLAPRTTYHYRVVASSVDGTSIGGDRTFTTAGVGPPQLTNLTESHSIFAVGKRGTPLTARTTARRHPKGTVFSFRLDRSATVIVTIQRSTPGRRVHGRCKPPSPALRRKPGCARLLTIGRLSRTARVGLNRVAFSGRIGTRALKPGRYRGVFTAIDAAGQSSPPLALNFTVVAR